MIKICMIIIPKRTIGCSVKTTIIDVTIFHFFKGTITKRLSCDVGIFIYLVNILGLVGILTTD